MLAVAVTGVAYFVYDTSTHSYKPDIIYATEEVIILFLKSPSSYKFTDAFFSYNNNNPEVTIYFESSNSFGVLMSDSLIINLEPIDLAKEYSELHSFMKEKYSEQEYFDSYIGRYLYDMSDIRSIDYSDSREINETIMLSIKSSLLLSSALGNNIPTKLGKIVEIKNNETVLENQIEKYEEKNLFEKIKTRLSLIV